MSYLDDDQMHALLEQIRQPSSTGPRITGTQLVALQRRWTAELRARIEAVFASAGATPRVDLVAQTWRVLAYELDKPRRLLDFHATRSPALMAAQRDEVRLLAVAAGLCDPSDSDDDVVRLGEDYRRMIRFGPSVSSHRKVGRNRRSLAADGVSQSTAKAR